MAATTIGVNPADGPDAVTITTGGTPGSKGVTIIVDDTKVKNQAQLDVCLQKAMERIRDKWPIPAS